MIHLVMVVKNEEATLGRCLASARNGAPDVRRPNDDPFISGWTIVDTGSEDNTQDVILDELDGIPGHIIERPWRSFGENLTEALELARDRGKWLLRLDADMTIEAHPNLLSWFAGDPDPTIDAWNVMIEDHGTNFRLPLLVRGGLEWRYVGATHEYLDYGTRSVRGLLGLTVTHHSDGSNRVDKHQRDLELLRPGYYAGEPRDTFYYAETLRFLGRTDEAAHVYSMRHKMNDGYEEERWYAGYQAAALRGSVAELIESWLERQHRHEPLSAAARIVAARENNDALFNEAL